MNFALALVAAVLAAPPQDSTTVLLKRARRAAEEYELLERTRAPVTWTSDAGGPCDEVVGRFCLRFDADDAPEKLPPLPAVAVRARSRAIRALERAARAAPADARNARTLVRLLVEAGEDTLAVRAAERFAGGGADRWADLLRGFALHAAGDDTAAVRLLLRGEAGLPEKEAKWLRPDRLVSPDEAAALKRLGPEARSRYDAALWKLADPLYLTAGNESLAEHLARYVWCRMLAEVPLVRGMTSWGDDLEELTFRYGVPRSRERAPDPVMFRADHMIEHYDPAQLAFLPESLLTVGVRDTPPPGAGWTLADPRAQSGYVPETVRRVTALPVSLFRVSAGDSVTLEVSAAFALDSLRAGAAAPDSVEVGLFLLRRTRALLAGDTAFVRTATGRVPVERDTARFTLSATVPPGRYIYSAEALAPGVGLAGRARYAVTLLATVAGLGVSDVLLTRAFAAERPVRRRDAALRALVPAEAASGDTVGVYLEVSGLTGERMRRYRVELQLGRDGGPSLGTRVLSWLHRRLGGAPAAPGVRLGWSGTAPPGRGPVPISTDLVVPPVGGGLYTLRVRVIDEATGAAAVTTGELRVRDRRP